MKAHDCEDSISLNLDLPGEAAALTASSCIRLANQRPQKMCGNHQRMYSGNTTAEAPWNCMAGRQNTVVLPAGGVKMLAESVPLGLQKEPS